MATTRKQLEALIAREAKASMEKMMLEQADQEKYADAVATSAGAGTAQAVPETPPAEKEDARSNMEVKASESTEAEKVAEEDIEMERSAMAQGNVHLNSHAPADAVGIAVAESVKADASTDASKAVAEKEATPLKTFAEQPNTVEVVDEKHYSCCMPWGYKAKAPPRTVGQAA